MPSACAQCGGPEVNTASGRDLATTRRSVRSAAGNHTPNLAILRKILLARLCGYGTECTTTSDGNCSNKRLSTGSQGRLGGAITLSRHPHWRKCRANPSRRYVPLAAEGGK